MATETLYYRDDETLSTSQGSSTDYLNWFMSDCVNYYFNYSTYSVRIKHSDDSFTSVGTNVANVCRLIATYTSPASGIQSTTWSCPESSMVATDKIEIIEKIGTASSCTQVSAASKTFLSGELGWTGLTNVTWTFYKYTDRWGSPGRCNFRYGSSTYNSYVSGIGYTEETNITVEPAASTSTLTLQTSTPVIYSDPSTFALSIASYAPAISRTGIVFPSEQTLTLSVGAPSITSISNVYSSTVELALSVEVPNANFSHLDTPSEQVMSLDVYDVILHNGHGAIPERQELAISVETPNIDFSSKYTASTLELGISLLDSAISNAVGPSVLPATISLLTSYVNIMNKPGSFALSLSEQAVNINISSTSGLLALSLDLRDPSIQRYIYDPIDKSGCPMCGTYLYRRGVNQVPKRRIFSEPVRHGRNFDRGEYKDDAYIKCSKCGFICNTQRDQYSHEGSRIGWGVKYEEVEAG